MIETEVGRKIKKEPAVVMELRPGLFGSDQEGFINEHWRSENSCN
jgi:hypothetical protein